VVCLGGGVGSGALPIFAQAARESGGLGIGVFTLPFSFEGQKRQRLAQRSLIESSAYLDAQLILANEKIFTASDQNTSFSAALSLINQNLVYNLNALVDIIRQPSLINIDFSDLRTVLRGHDQTVFLNTAVTRGEKRLEQALEKIGRYDFYYDEPAPAEKILLHVCGGSDLKMIEVETISQEIKKPNPSAQIIFGVDRKVNFRDQIKVVLLSICSKAEKKNVPVSIPKKEKRKTKKRKTVKKTKQPDKIKSEQSKKVKRLNAIDVKEIKKKSEFQKTSQEKIWEIPAFLRRKP